MQTKYKRIILIFACIVLALLVSTPLIRFGDFSKNYESPLSDKDILSAEEINSFLEVYIDYMASTLPETVVSISLQNETDFPAPVKRWFFAKGWSAKRFFAVEQKIKKLMSIVTLKNNLEANRKLKAENPSMGLAEIIKQQEGQLKQSKYDEQELELIADNFDHISQFFRNGK